MRRTVRGLSGETQAPASELPTPVEAVLLDAGGVLLDLDYPYLRRLIEAEQVEVSEIELSRAEAIARRDLNDSVRNGDSVADRWREYFHIILGRVGVRGDAHNGLIDSLWEAHDRVGLWTVAIDGALDAVSELRRRGLRLGVISNAEGTVARNLNDAGFGGAFDAVVDSHLVGVSKPDPEIFRIALERMSLQAERAIFVGDMPEIDVKGAHAAGIVPVLLDRHDLHADVPATRIRSLAELSPLIA